MLSFLTPLFLAGVVAVGIPILVHLRLRERRTAQPFPSLMFIRRIPHKSFRRRTLQNLLLFAARTLAVILLCVAFARPFFPANASAAAAQAGPVGRVIALDVSASMGYEGVFPRALAQAEQAIRESKPADWVGVLLFSDQVQGLAPPSTDRAKALAALRDAVPGSRSTRFAPALRLAGDWLSALKVDRREVILVTDGQTRATAGVADLTLPPQTSILVRSVAPPTPGNTAVTEVTVEHVVEQGKGADRRFAIVTARLLHQGDTARTVSATLEVAGRIIEEKSVPLPRSGALSVTFARAPLPAGVSKGRILLKPDKLAMDDTFHFVLGASGDIPVLLIDPSPYVARALEIGSQPSFDIVRRQTLAASDLAGRSLIVLGALGPGGLGASASTALASFVREGGGLLATTPLSGLRGEAAQMLPAAWGENVSRLADRGASLGFVDLDHPALFAFKQARGSDFSRARFLQYRALKVGTGPEAERLKVLARFDDGREALVAASFGDGRVVAFTSSLDGLTSDLPVQPLFLPLIHELARHAAALAETPLYHRVGAAVDIIGGAKAGDNPPTQVASPEGRKTALGPGATGLELNVAGFYEAIRASGTGTIIAANLESAESDLTTLEADELGVALRPSGRSEEAAVEAGSADTSARQAWWRLALLSVVLLMGAETILGNAKGQKATS